MPQNNYLEKIKKTLEGVKHPAIDADLVELGIIKNVRLEGKSIIITLAFPFENIPIKDHLISLVKTALLGLKKEIKIKTTVMDQGELNNFMALEKAHWKM